MLTTAHILLIESESPLRRFLETTLTAGGYTVSAAQSVDAALAIDGAGSANVILLGFAVWGPAEQATLGLVRQRLRGSVLVMAPRQSELQRRQILQAGAGDVAAKPISPGEVLARVQSLLYGSVYRRDESAVIVLPDLVIDTVRQTVSAAGAEVALTGSEYNLLRVLALHAGETLAPVPLCRAAFGAGYKRELDHLPWLIQSLRRKLEGDHALVGRIQADRGAGYRWQHGSAAQEKSTSEGW